MSDVSDVSDVNAFKPGLYRHHKGGLYTAVCLVTHHETREPMVLYVSHQYGGMNVRPLNGWAAAGDRGKCEDTDAWNDLVHGAYDTGDPPQRRFVFVGDLPSDTPIRDR